MWQQNWDWPLPFPLKGLKWTKVHPVSTLEYKICVQLDEYVKQEVCVRVWNTVNVSKYSVVKYSEAKWTSTGSLPHLQRWPAAEIWSTRELAASN